MFDKARLYEAIKSGPMVYVLHGCMPLSRLYTFRIALGARLPEGELSSLSLQVEFLRGKSPGKSAREMTLMPYQLQHLATLSRALITAGDTLGLYLQMAPLPKNVVWNLQLDFGSPHGRLELKPAP